MAELAIVRTEIKAWERSFKEEHGRAATVDDVKQDDAMGAPTLSEGQGICLPINLANKYRLYKRLCKVSANSNVVQKEKDEISPRPATPPRSTRLKDPTSGLLSRSRLIEPAAPLAAFNPFSPQKKRRGKEKELSLEIEDPRRSLFGKSGSTSSSEGRSLSPNPFPPIEASSSTHSSELSVPPAPTSAVSRARKRLRGEPVSPSPNKEKRRRVLSQNANPFPRINMDARDSDDDAEVSDADLSFVDNSPVKVLVGGKVFPKLFTESSPPPTDLFGIKSKPQVGRLDKRASFQSNQKAIHTTRVQNTRKRTRSGSPEFNSAQFDVTGRNEASSENPINQLTIKHPDDDAGNDPPRLKRPKSPLIPPSPPPAATTTSFKRPSKHPIKTHISSRGRKKAKIDEQSTSETDGTELSPKLKIVNRHNARLKQVEAGVQNEDEADGWDSDTILSRTRFAEPRAASPDTAGGHVEVNLPDELRRVLALESVAPQAKIPNEDKLVKDLLYGRRTTYYYPNKGGEIWDVGEDHLTSVASESIQNPGEEEDWEGEPVPWEVAEL
jgi:hypothetical protein